MYTYENMKDIRGLKKCSIQGYLTGGFIVLQYTNGIFGAS